jgi:hypothetical protein
MGKSYDQILSADCDLTYSHIFAAAEEALSLGASRLQHQARKDRVIAQYPMAWQPWTEADERRLSEGYRSGRSISSLADQLQRRPNAIRSRLIRLGFFEVA